MDFSQLVQYGVLVSLLGTLLAGFVGFFAKSTLSRYFSYGFLATANLMGTIAILFFLTSGHGTLMIATSAYGYQFRFDLDVLSAIFYLIVTLISGICSVYAAAYVERYKETYHLPSLALATSLFIFGMQSVLLSSNIAGFMIFWEVMSVSSFFLVMANQEKDSIKAALLYLVMTHLGAGALLAGFFLLSNGSILTDLSLLGSTSQTLSTGTLTLAFLLFLFGFGSKAGLVPFHIWLPEAHPQAPSHISALMSGVMLKVALYGFLRVISLFPMMPAWFGLLVLALGILSAIVGVLYAIIETDIKRTLAFSSIENMGLIFMMLGIGLFAYSQGQPLLGGLSFIAAIFHSVVHAVFKSGLFLTAGAIISETHTRSLESMGGLAKRMPILSGAFCILALSAAALPPLGAFFGEWIFLQSVVGILSSGIIDSLFNGVLLIALVGFVFVSGLAIFAMVKLFAIACLGKPRSDHAGHAKDPELFLLSPILLLSLLMVGIGAFAPYLLTLLQAGVLADINEFASFITIPSVGSISPIIVFLSLLTAVLFTFVLRRLFSNFKNERPYHTWDCGQPITSKMEYTATAFTAPIRFFFRIILRAQKVVIATPVLETNRWIYQRTMKLQVKSIFMTYLYHPIEIGLTWASTLVRKIQNGSIQLYLALIFITLLVTLMIAL